MSPVRPAPLARLSLALSLVLSACALGAPAVHAARHAPATVRPAVRALHPAAGPQLLTTVPANANPPHVGWGDPRFGVVEAFERPQQATALHVGWERVQIRWDLLQPRSPLQWDANATANDRPYDQEIAAGRQLVGVLQGIPSWAAQDPQDGNAAVPQNLALPWSDPRNYWGQFVFRAARHYAGRIDTLVILNEVNIASGPYHQFRGTVADYAQMLRVAYLAAHAANPHVEVHIYGDSVYADQGAWFRQVIAALARFPDARANDFFFDAAEVHLYSTVLHWDSVIAAWHAAMQAYGFDRPIWLSETNVSPRNDRGHQVPTAFPANHNTPLALQPNFLIASFAAALGLGLPRIEVYRMLDPQHIQIEHPNGLVRRDGSRRPEYYAFATANRWLAGVTAARYEPCTTYYVDTSCLVRVVLERPGQEIQVLWNQGGKAMTASVPAVAPTATVVRPLGQTRTIRAVQGRFVLPLAGATDRAVAPVGHIPDGKITSLTQLRFTNEIKIGSAPLIVVQDLPTGAHVPGLHPLVVERDRSAGAGDALGPVTSLALAPDGSGRRALADTAHDRVLIEDAHGHITARLGGTGGAPGQFRGPAGVAIGADGTLYVADQGNARLQEFDLQGHLLGGFGRDDAGVAALRAPVSVAAAPDGTIYVVDAAQDAVLHFTRMGGFLGRWGSPGYGSGQLDGPGGLAVDRSGTVYVADTLNNRVVAYDAQGHTLTQLGTGTPAAGSDSLHWPTAVTALPGGGVAIADAGNGRIVTVAHPQTYLGSVALGGVRQPGGLALAPDGSYFVSDTAANRIVHLDAAGHQLGAFGSRGVGEGQVFQPLGLALGPDGNLYVADSGNNRIEVLSQRGHFVRALGQQGHQPGQFLGPHAVSVAADGSLWVADTFNARVQHLSATGTVLGIVATHVNGAWGVAADPQGGVYYTAHWGQRLYHVDRAGQVMRWGAPGSGAGEFTHPGALALAGDGTLYAVDEGNARLQYLREWHLAGQRGSGTPGPSGLGDPVAVAVTPAGAIVVLDAARHRLVSYQGAQAGAFNVMTLPDVPLGLIADAAGFDVATYGQWTGLSTQHTVSMGNQ